jgi:phosphatidylserine/phosphatidylglycerophosphate/cardiolipin synthase-like enzyme
MGVKINIVTLPVTVNNYKNRVKYVKELLDFLDEIGCNIYLNSNLHSKLILSNDLALIGSFNLSKAALYDREEIGVTIDDMQNLKIIESYIHEVIESSEPFGFNAKLESSIQHIQSSHGNLHTQQISEKLTRGWLFEDIARLWGRKSFDQRPQNMHYSFLCEWCAISPYYNEMLKEISVDLKDFYVRVYKAFFDWEPKEFLKYLRQRFGYNKYARCEEITNFLESKQARKNIPKKHLNISSFDLPDRI